MTDPDRPSLRAVPDVGSQRGARLRQLLSPRRVAIIGASEDPKKYGYIIPQCLIDGGFTGEVVLVNPKGGRALGRDFFKSLADCPRPIDLAVTTLPPERLESAMSDCAAAQAGGVVIFTAGLGEMGGEGAALQERLAAMARAGRVRIVGPNCLGLFNASAKLNLLASPDVPAGRIGLATQSGGLAEMFFVEGKRLGGGLSLCISLGNQADVEMDEAVEALADDPNTAVAVVYLEGLRNGKAFIEAVRSAARRKPVVVIKGGRTRAGGRTTLSHTASLAGSAEVYSSLLRAAGAVVVDDLQDLYAIALTLAHCPVARGPNVALIGGGGGQATLMADAMEERGLSVPEFSAELQRNLRAMLISRSTVCNPIEFAGANERAFSVYDRCVELAMSQEAIDAVLVYGSFGGFRTDLESETNSYARSAAAFGELVRRFGKPVVVHSSHANRDLPGIRALRESGIPVLAAPETAAACVAALYQAGHNIRDPACKRPAPAARHVKQDGLLPFADAARKAARFGIPVVPLTAAATADDAATIAAGFGYPVALKLVAPLVAHKTEAGGVVANLISERELREAYDRMFASALPLDPACKPVLGIAPMVRSGAEFVVGAVRDTSFGPIVMVGAGGIAVEMFRDVAFSLAGIDHAEALELIARTKFGRAMGEWRGNALNQSALASVVVAVSEMMLACPEIIEIDLNPVFVSRQGAQAADLRVVETAPPAGMFAGPGQPTSTRAGAGTGRGKP